MKVISVLCPFLGAILMFASCEAKSEPSQHLIESKIHFALQVDAPSQKYNGAYLDTLPINDNLAMAVGVKLNGQRHKTSVRMMLINLGDTAKKIPSSRVFSWQIHNAGEPLFYNYLNKTDQVTKSKDELAPLFFTTPINNSSFLFPVLYPTLNPAEANLRNTVVYNTKYPGNLNMKVTDTDTKSQWVVCGGVAGEDVSSNLDGDGKMVKYKMIFWAPPEDTLAKRQKCVPVKLKLVPCLDKDGKYITEGKCAIGK